MERSHVSPVSATILIEACPGCGSVDVRALEPHWFAVALDRRDDLQGDPAGDDGCVAYVEFGCRDCGLRWD